MPKDKKEQTKKADIGRAELIKQTSKLEPLIKENNELISIFVTSINTARRNKKKTS